MCSSDCPTCKSRRCVSTEGALSAERQMCMYQSASKVITELHTPDFNLLPAAVKAQILCHPILNTESRSLILLSLIVTLAASDVRCTRSLLLYLGSIENCHQHFHFWKKGSGAFNSHKKPGSQFYVS